MCQSLNQVQQIVLFVENVVVCCLSHLVKYMLFLLVQIFSVKGSFLSEKGGVEGGLSIETLISSTQSMTMVFYEDPFFINTVNNYDIM